jgi:nucleotide-binding universal stress UspA family protein
MYANILLSTDGSDVARKGLKHGLALAKALNARATVITVSEPLPGAVGAGTAVWVPSQQEIDSMTLPTENMRAKSSMKLEPSQSTPG